MVRKMFADVLQINYIILKNTEESLSRFSNYDINVRLYFEKIRFIQTLPAVILDIGMDIKGLCARRRNFQIGHRILLLSKDEIVDFDSRNYFNVLIVDTSNDLPIPLLNTFIINYTKNINSVKKQLFDYFYPKLISFQKKYSEEIPIDSVKKIKYIDKDEFIEISKQIKINKNTEIFATQLENFGFRFLNKNTIDGNNIEFWETIIPEITDNYPKDHSHIDLIFAVPSTLPMAKINTNSLTTNQSHLLRLFLSCDTNEKIQRLNYLSESKLEYLKLLEKERNVELEIFYECLKIIFEHNFAPILVSNIYKSTKFQDDYQKFIYAKETSNKKAFLKLANTLSSEFGKEYISILPKNKIPEIKIYSDLPIEFLLDDKYKIPLLFTTSITKIPNIPGNLFLENICSQQNIYVKSNELKKILIISSFKENDPLNGVLKKSIDIVFDDKYSIPKLEIEYININSCKELTNLLNEDNHNIVIFDCHGFQDPKEKYGYLSIGNEKFDIWNNHEIKHVPPIVLFSACDTCFIGSSSFSVANGFLMKGAIATIGTNNPVSGIESSIFISRILLRIAMALDIFVEQLTSISWLDFISDFFRMSYSSEIIQFVCKKNNQSSETIIDIWSKSNMCINKKELDWFPQLLSLLEKYTNISKDQIHKTIQNDLGFTETMKYISLGNADRIIIHN